MVCHCPDGFLPAGSGHGSSGTPTLRVTREVDVCLAAGVRAPRPTGNGMVTVGADARIVFAAARRTGCGRHAPMPPGIFRRRNAPGCRERRPLQQPVKHKNKIFYQIFFPCNNSDTTGV